MSFLISSYLTFLKEVVNVLDVQTFRKPVGDNINHYSLKKNFKSDDWIYKQLNSNGTRDDHYVFTNENGVLQHELMKT